MRVHHTGTDISRFFLQCLNYSYFPQGVGNRIFNVWHGLSLPIHCSYLKTNLLHLHSGPWASWEAMRKTLTHFFLRINAYWTSLIDSNILKYILLPWKYYYREEIIARKLTSRVLTWAQNPEYDGPYWGWCRRPWHRSVYTYRRVTKLLSINIYWF